MRTTKTCMEQSATRDSGLLLTFDIPEGDQVSPFSSVIRLTWRHLLWWSADVCIELCNSFKSATDKLQRVLNAAARLVSGTRKFDRGLSRLLHVDLHWLDVPEHVQYKLGVTVRRCQQHKAPQYLIVLRQPWTSPADSDYALPVVTNFLCRVTNSAHLVVGPSLSLNKRLGIRCRLTSVIRRVVTSLSDVQWKHSCSLSTSVSSALEVFLWRCAI